MTADANPLRHTSEVDAEVLSAGSLSAELSLIRSFKMLKAVILIGGPQKGKKPMLHFVVFLFCLFTRLSEARLPANANEDPSLSVFSLTWQIIRQTKQQPACFQSCDSSQHMSLTLCKKTCMSLYGIIFM